MKKYAEFEQPLTNFVNSFDTHADAANALGVHPSAVTQALNDVKEGKREVFVKNRKEKGVFPAISVRMFGNRKQARKGL